MSYVSLWLLLCACQFNRQLKESLQHARAYKRVFHRVSTLEVVIICLGIQDIYRDSLDRKYSRCAWKSDQRAEALVLSSWAPKTCAVLSPSSPIWVPSLLSALVEAKSIYNGVSWSPGKPDITFPSPTLLSQGLSLPTMACGPWHAENWLRGVFF